jgi:hypothetical protein
VTRSLADILRSFSIHFILPVPRNSNAELPINPQGIQEFLGALRLTEQIFPALGAIFQKTLAHRIWLAELGADACNFFRYFR